MKYLYLALSSIIIVYLVVLIFIYFYQRNLLYHPAENNYQNDEAKFNYDEVYIEVDSSIKLKSWFINKDLSSLLSNLDGLYAPIPPVLLPLSPSNTLL